MTILATMFDSMRGFRKQVGRVRLYYIQEYLADGRIIRMSNGDQAQYVPLLKDKVAGRYDVIVEDAPTSPNQREQTWATLQPMMKAFEKAMTPAMAVELMSFSPLPTWVVSKIRELASQPNPLHQQQQQQAIEAQDAKTQLMQAKAELARVQATVQAIAAHLSVVEAAQPVPVAPPMPPQPPPAPPVPVQPRMPVAA
jgi:crotonobetainyl-CoA:carnitine CoA-transferase CaiB-like acyl-CoA transferase